MESVLAPVKAGWELFKKHKFFTWKVLGTTFALQIVYQIFNYGNQGEVPGLLALFVLLFTFFLELGAISLFLKLAREGKEGDIREIISQKKIFFRAFVSYIGVLFVLSLVSVILAILALVVLSSGRGTSGIFIIVFFPFFFFPLMLWVLARLLFLLHIFVDQQLSIWEAFKESDRLTKNHLWKMLLFVLLLMVLNTLGAIFFFVGLLITVPVTLLAITIAYLALYDPKRTEEVPVAVEIEEAPVAAP